MLRDLTKAVQAREIRAVELVERSLERISADPANLNAVVAFRADEAMLEATALDARIDAGGSAGLLAGAPCLIKDIEDLSGVQTTHGSLLFLSESPPARDGLMASRLRAADAIPLGKTNTPEFASEGFTSNAVFGDTLNPWAPEWSPCGSSGGSGAALAAGFAPIATATDTGGSIRGPAAFCGLVGLKPTNGLIGRDFNLPWPDLTTCGPLGVSVDDVRILLEATAGPVIGDPTALPYRPPEIAELPRLILATERLTSSEPLPSAVAHAFDDALGDVVNVLKIPTEWISADQIFRSGNPEIDWYTMAGPELVAWLGRRRTEKGLELMHPTTRAFLAEGLATSLDEYLSARFRRFDYVRELDELLGIDVVIASPTIASEGWLPHGPRPGYDEASPGPETYSNCITQNVTGHPAITVPAGRFSNGVPFGLQFTGPRFHDGLLLNLAQRWEEARPWPLSATAYEPFWS